jgi:hypothetical protein
MMAFKSASLWTVYTLAYILILLGLTSYNATIGSEYRLFELCSNGKQDSGRECHSNQTLTVAVFRILVGKKKRQV